MGVVEAVAGVVPCVKVQAACFERYGGAGGGGGFGVMFEVIEAAKSAGLIVIADAKRGDIGISAEHYATGFLGEADQQQKSEGISGTESPLRMSPRRQHRAHADALTVNPYLGGDTLTPFIDTGAGVFVLVRTSNAGSDSVQSLALNDGRSVSEAVADMVADLGRPHVGESGYSTVGAVVGATKKADAAALRVRMPEQIFLVPGYGAQGGSADDVRACFKPDGTGALITASRSIIYAFDDHDTDRDWQASVRAAAERMRDQIVVN